MMIRNRWRGLLWVRYAFCCSRQHRLKWPRRMGWSCKILVLDLVLDYATDDGDGDDVEKIKVRCPEGEERSRRGYFLFYIRSSFSFV